MGVQVAWSGDMVTWPDDVVTWSGDVTTCGCMVWSGGVIATTRHYIMSDKVSCLTRDLFALVSYKAAMFSLHTLFYHKVIFSSTPVLPLQLPYTSKILTLFNSQMSSPTPSVVSDSTETIQYSPYLPPVSLGSPILGFERGFDGLPLTPEVQIKQEGGSGNHNTAKGKRKRDDGLVIATNKKGEVKGYHNTRINLTVFS